MMRPKLLLITILAIIVLLMCIVSYILHICLRVDLYQAVIISVTAIPALTYQTLLFWDRLRQMPAIELGKEYLLHFPANEPFRLYVGLRNLCYKDLVLVTRAEIADEKQKMHN